MSSTQPRLTAVLGPTNTGKTYLAIERMLGHASGMMGFPLRLLARENYDRVARIKGHGQVALITGEEKIIPPGARYFLCTVESMPLEREVDFLAIDEIQLAADPERGHVFTDRLLHARGASETMLLGAETIRPLIRQLLPGAEIISRPRFSKLSYAGHKKLTRLPRRSAVVAFSASEVYATAELIRRQRGGTAVVMGALSPRTRNAQVAMFEAGEVDYLVATDAIGMGLNLDVDHVAFAKLSKFDGRAPRRLTFAEVAQIAGRAGRHMSDGTFGTTGNLQGMDQEMVEAVEEHSFEPLTLLSWRNRDLNFRSPKDLLRSLERNPDNPVLRRAREAEDHQHLIALAKDEGVLARATNPAAVRLLWEVAQVPDFSQTLTDQHLRLLTQIYDHLNEGGRLPGPFVEAQLQRLDRTEGDIDSLTARLASVRTWTFITHRADWLDEAGDWREKARAIEDRLSDALHDRLTQRFVDTRAATLIRRLQGGEALMSAVRQNGEVVVEGMTVGQLNGFHFELDASVSKDDARAVLTAARRALMEEIPSRLNQLEADNDGAFLLLDDGGLTWRGQPVGKIVKGASPLTPQVEAINNEFFDGPMRERLRLRLVAWLERHLKNRLAHLYALESAELTAGARGLAFQLAENMGCLSRQSVAQQVRALDKDERAALAKLKVRLGALSIFIPPLLKPQTQQLRALLWAVFTGGEKLVIPEGGIASFTPGHDEAALNACGYRLLTAKSGKIAARADSVEKLANEARKLAEQGPFAPAPMLAQILETDADGLAIALIGMGFSAQKDEAAGLVFHPRGARSNKPAAVKADGAKGEGKKRAKPKGQRPKGARKPEKQADPNSPFAVLKDLKIGG